MTEIASLINKRWSPRSFAERPIETADLLSLFEAARWAPSCYNDQPWGFVVGRRGVGDGYERIANTLIPFNQSWARTAPVLVIAVAREQFARNGEVNRHAFYDLGMAMGNLLTQATALDLFVHQMAGFDFEAAAEVLALPAAHVAVAAAAIGYLGDADRLPEDMEEKDPATRERHELAAMVFEGRWGEAVK